MPQVSPKPPQFRLSLQVAGTKQTKIGSSVIDALEKINPKNLSKGRTVITLQVNKRKAEIMLMPLQAKRLFVNKIAKQLCEKRLIGALH